MPKSVDSSEQSEWKYSPLTIACLLMCCGPVGLFLTWTSPWMRNTKIAITVGWCLLALLGALIPKDAPERERPTSAERTEATNGAGSTPAATGGAENDGHAAAPVDVEELKRLYRELLAFKSEPQFKQVGFGVCCKYNKWLKRVEALRDTGNADGWLKVGVLPGDLLMVGLKYAHSKGAETEFTRDRVRAFDAALFPPAPKKGFTGTVVRSDRYCRSLATYKRMLDLDVKGKIAESQDLLWNESLCVKIHQNTPARGPLDRKTQDEIDYVQVDVQGIGKVWAMDGTVEFADAH